MSNGKSYSILASVLFLLFNFITEGALAQEFSYAHANVITPKGDIFKLAKNSKSSSEFAGATFSPDGSTLFVNIQVDGLTLAITGPWDAKQA